MIYALFALLMLCSCSPNAARRPVRSAYYWSTTLCIDSAKQAFLSRHAISRLYVRYFDVVVGEQGRPEPNATLRFQGGVPSGVEVVPTVFIVNDVMRADTAGLAQRVFARVMQMSATNDVRGVREMQIDCDWTLTTQRRFFAFMQQMRRLCHDRGLRLSATIRFHQLSQPAPPCDRGVLMVYNTGDFTRLDEQKPILDIADVRQYLGHLRRYSLPLAEAYPVYSWRLLFRGSHFVGIMHADDDLPVLPTDTIVLRQPSIDDILQARQAVSGKIGRPERETIIFDLSNQNIHHYKSSEYEKIFGS